MMWVTWSDMVFAVFVQLLVKLDLIQGTTVTLARSKDAVGEFSYHEVITPQVYHRGQKIDTTLIKAHHAENITVIVRSNTTKFTLDLLLNRQLFSPKYIEKHFTKEGEEVINKNIKEDGSHCYYHGHVRGHSRSIVALSTCQGISGYISVGSEAYHIEPITSVISDRHYLFRDSDRIPDNLKCGQDGDVPNMPKNDDKIRKSRLKREVLWPYDATEGSTKIVELYVVNDYAQYKFYEYNIMKVVRRTKDIINVVSSLYRPLGIYVALVGVETWIESDKIQVEDNADKTMNNFLSYRRQDISPKHPNDNAQLITGQKLGDGVVGKAPIMTICSWRYSGGVNMDHSSLVGPVATTVAHEMGHNFGLAHDTEACQCPDERCIMAPSSGGIKNPTKWSSCSKEQFDDAFYQGMDHCLHNLPEDLYGNTVCGNGFVEEGEECDCGLVEDCDTTCCDPTECKLTVNATCATGTCCDLDTCQVKKATTPCREVYGECDLGEYCDGKTEHCPSDAYLKDGTGCVHNYIDSYCYKGKCVTRDAQCKKLWGTSGAVSNDLCFEHFNIMGLANGHCGFDWVDSTFKKCRKEDVMCGMLHCSHRNEKLMFWKEALAYTMPEAWVMVNGQRKECKGAILDVGLDTLDPGMTPEGSKCGKDKLCVNTRCTAVQDMALLECPDCNGRGVCNNLGQCHCDVGYGPPYCDGKGDGGSIQSGPIKIQSGNLSLVIAMCILFLLILPLVALLTFFGYKHREKLKKLWSGAYADRYRSIYRAKPRHDIENHDSSRSPPSRAAVSTIANSHPPPMQSDRNRTPNVAIVAPQRSAPAPKPVRPAPKRPPGGINRTPSVTREDIGSPKLQSHTNEHLPTIPTLDRAPSNARDNQPDVVPSRRAPAVPPALRDNYHNSPSYLHKNPSRPERPAPPVIMDTTKYTPPSRPPPPRQKSIGKSGKLAKTPPALPPSPPASPPLRPNNDCYENQPGYDPENIYEPMEFVEVDLASPTDNNTPFTRPSDSQGPASDSSNHRIQKMIGRFNNNPGPDPGKKLNRTNGNNNILSNTNSDSNSVKKPPTAPKPSELKRQVSGATDKPAPPPKPSAGKLSLGSNNNRDSQPPAGKVSAMLSAFGNRTEI